MPLLHCILEPMSKPKNINSASNRTFDLTLTKIMIQ